MKGQKILIAGATGYVGGHLVPHLIEKGYQVRCMARDPEKVLAKEWKDIEVVRADALDRSSLGRALEEIDIAYYLIHSMGGHKDFQSKDIQAAQNFSEVASKNNVQRIIYLGGLGKSKDNLSPHLESRQKVARILRSTDVPITELRASIIIGAGSSSFEIIRDLAKRLRVMITPKWVNSKCEPIAIQNVIDYLVGCLEVEKTTGATLDIGGGQVFTYGEMMRLVASIMGKRILMIQAPVLTPRLSAYWLNLVTTVPMSIAYPLVEGLRNDTICEDNRIRNWIPLDLIPFTKAVGYALTSADLTSRWTEANQMKDEYPFPKSTGHLLSNTQKIETSASQNSLFHAIERIGGKNGWYSVDWAWKLRGLMDRIVGGVGIRRGRRDPEHLRAGDALDFWRVLEIKENRSLTLLAEMKLPGYAWLHFEIHPLENSGHVFMQSALFQPSG